MSAAGVDTWSPSWYVDRDGAAGAWLSEHATVPSVRGSRLLPDPVLGQRVGWFPSGLVFAEGRPGGDGGLCPLPELPGAFERLVHALRALGLALPEGVAAAEWDGLPGTVQRYGQAGVRRCDATVNLSMSRAEGLAFLSGFAACARDAGHAETRTAADRAIATVYMRGRAGKSALGRAYDKGLEALSAPRGELIRVEDQRRWGKGSRREVAELTSAYVKTKFQSRFYPLYKASKGVTVAGYVVIAEKVLEAVRDGELGRQQGRLLIADTVLEAIGAGREVVAASTLRRSRAMRRELGLVLADGVLEEVEVDVASVLEAALETDAWERRG